MAPFDWGLFLAHLGLAASPAMNAAFESLEFITTYPSTAELPEAVGHELCISQAPGHDHFWRDVLDRYLLRFPLFPRVLSNTKHNAGPQHQCSLYLLLEPDSQPRQVFLRLQFLSVNGNWNQAARFVVAINALRFTRDLSNHLQNFELMGIRNGMLLMCAPHVNRTFAMFSRAIGQLDYAMTVEDLPPLVERYSDRHLEGVTVGVTNRFEFPLLMIDGQRIGGMYYKFLMLFARKYRCQVAFQVQPVHLVLTLNNRESLAKPLAIGSFTGDCVIVPERAKDGLLYFLLSPFSASVWCICGVLILVAVLLNWKYARCFPNNILLTVLFGDQQEGEDSAYPRLEDRVIFVGVVMLFFLSESYLAKLLSTFIASLNEPHLKTLADLAHSDIPLSVTNFDQIESYEQLHHNLEIVEEDEHAEHMRRGSHAFMVECGNAELMVHSKAFRQSNGFEVPHYALQEFTGWRMNGFALSKYAPIATQMVELTGLVAQAGLWVHWKNHYLRQLNNMRHHMFTSRETLHLEDLLSLQYLLFGGYALAVVAFVAELAVHYIPKSNSVRWIGRNIIAK
ncbi:AGAP005679-PA-like protein [Anopheles sinensis]|uniref:AGAP005679-PA-like protein n=1 Tax=Anopheles sinensis TaxID=74873 RepID=A0A084W4A2_ANOSI|nr:AGAP005679-PA-like protein [Anopheles sinensis]